MKMDEASDIDKRLVVIQMQLQNIYKITIVLIMFIIYMAVELIDQISYAFQKELI